jgi:hypothetical protein
MANPTMAERLDQSSELLLAQPEQALQTAEMVGTGSGTGVGSGYGGAWVAE